jgi:hypothetical protein
LKYGGDLERLRGLAGQEIDLEYGKKRPDEGVDFLADEDLAELAIRLFFFAIIKGTQK